MFATRTVLFTAILVLAGGLPFALSRNNDLPLKERWHRFWNKTTDKVEVDNQGQRSWAEIPVVTGLGSTAARVSEVGLPRLPPPLKQSMTPEISQAVGPPMTSLADIFRFDVGPSWVTKNWSHVTSDLAELELNGLRVPLMTGTQSYDLAGALTYYFDKFQRMQRLTFQGQTHDEFPIVSFFQSYYNLKQVPTLVGSLYIAKKKSTNDQPETVTSALIVRSAKTFNRPPKTGQIRIDLEINHPITGFGLTNSMQKRLDTDRKAQLW